MRENVIDFRTKEQKRADFKEKFNQEIQNAKNWIVNNKEWLITLTPKEWLEIDRRKNNGERLADILREMKVLK